MQPDSQRAAELQVLLEGVALPASRQQLVDYAAAQPGGERFGSELRSLPDREYRALDDVGEALAPSQPLASASSPPLPHAESGLPPGGDAYVEPHPQPGAVDPEAPPDNPPLKAIEHQSETQKKQQERRERS